MPVLMVLSLLIQIAFVVHVIKTGREQMWIWIILFFPVVGCAVYFFLEVLPDLRRSHIGKNAATKVFKAIDPKRELKRLAKELAISDNVDNKVKLAESCVVEGLYDEAVNLYNNALTGVYKDDPDIMLGLATALFHQENYVQAKDTLKHLIDPEFKSQTGHLLFARTLEALQDSEVALEEYSILISYYSGYEAKCRYALLLKKLGYTEKANDLFKDILTRSQQVPKQFRKAQKQWIEIASQQLD